MPHLIEIASEVEEDLMQAGVEGEFSAATVSNFPEALGSSTKGKKESEHKESTEDVRAFSPGERYRLKRSEQKHTQQFKAI